MKLRLIGAETFICRPAGIMDVIKAGDTVEVDDAFVDHLLSLTYADKDQEFSLFSKNLKAKVQTKAVRAIPIETRRALDAETAETERRIKDAEERAAAAEARESDILERIANLENSGVEKTDAKAPKKATRTRKSAASKAAASAQA